MNAEKNESWSQRLATMPTSRILHVQESMARDITAEKNLEQLRVRTTPALVNFSKDRPGLFIRGYEYDNRKGSRRSPNLLRNSRAPDGKNPVRNYTRLLCRKSGSDELVLRDCDQLSPANRVRFSELILLSESVCSESGECNHALDIAQKYDDASWKELENSLSSPSDEEKGGRSNINFNITATEETEKRSFETLADNSFLHSINCSFSDFNDPISSTVYKSNSHDFEGTCKYDGAGKSLVGILAYLRYCTHIQRPFQLQSSSKRFTLGSVVRRIIEKAIIRFPIDSHGNFLEYTLYIVDVDITILFGLAKMKELKWYVNEVTEEFCSFLKPVLKVKLAFLAWASIPPVARFPHTL